MEKKSCPPNELEIVEIPPQEVPLPLQLPVVGATYSRGMLPAIPWIAPSDSLPMRSPRTSSRRSLLSTSVVLDARTTITRVSVSTQTPTMPVPVPTYSHLRLSPHLTPVYPRGPVERFLRESVPPFTGSGDSSTRSTTTTSLLPTPPARVSAPGSPTISQLRQELGLNPRPTKKQKPDLRASAMTLETVTTSDAPASAATVCPESSSVFHYSLYDGTAADPIVLE
jgi:hypothetical protein